jgi:hypothetical protein
VGGATYFALDRLRIRGGWRKTAANVLSLLAYAVAGLGLVALIGVWRSPNHLTIAVETAREDTTKSIFQIRCYRSPHSILLGPAIGRRNMGHPPGWLRIEWVARDTSGAAELVDANGARLGARWYRLQTDSLRVVGADDFLRTELRIVMNADSLRGQAHAHSDADIERDSAGKLGDVRRAWQVSATRIPCDSMPTA